MIHADQGERRAVFPLKRRRGGDGGRRLAEEPQAGTDHCAIDGRAGALRVVGVRCGIRGGRAFLGEMIDEHRVGVVSGLRVAGVFGLRAVVAVVKPETRLRAGLQVGNLHPDKRLAHERIVFLDVESERRLVVRRDEAEIAAVLFRRLELEIAVEQPQQHHRRADRVGDVSGLAPVSMVIFLRTVQPPFHHALALPVSARIAARPHSRDFKKWESLFFIMV